MQPKVTPAVQTGKRKRPPADLDSDDEGDQAFSRVLDIQERIFELLDVNRTDSVPPEQLLGFLVLGGYISVPTNSRDFNQTAAEVFVDFQIDESSTDRRLRARQSLRACQSAQ